MSNPSADDEQPLDPAAARVVTKVRWLMLIAGATTATAVAAVIGVIGYRLLRSEGSAGTAGAAGVFGAPAEVTALLPKGARIVGTGVTEGQVVVTVEIAGATEIRTFDARSLRPVGRLRFVAEP
jgi:hypothetical protein